MEMYFIAIVLPAKLNEEVLQYKRTMLERFNCKVGLKSPAHITIIPPYWMEKEKEQSLIVDINNLSTTVHSFPITTKDFSAFKPRTIFIDVNRNEKLQEVKKRADELFSASYPIKLESRPFYPHITIATRDLYKKAFSEAWTIFEHKKFEEEWVADGLSVLRHNKKNWDVIHTSQFNNL